MGYNEQGIVIRSEGKKLSLSKCLSNCGPRRSAGGFGRKSITKIVPDTE
jgi:hypothetical protein